MNEYGELLPLWPVSWEDNNRPLIDEARGIYGRGERLEILLESILAEDLAGPGY